jgi:hypothetical protein
LKNVLQPILKGGVDDYVDDFMGCCHRRDVVGDMGIAKMKIEELLGSKSVEDTKSENGRVMEFIGWLVNLDTRMVAVAPKNLFRALHGLFTIDLEGGTITVKELEQFVGWAQRYKMICRPLEAFVYGFYRLKSYHTTPTKSLMLTNEVKLDITLWRAYLCLTQLRPLKFARSIESFRHQDARLLLETDACLTGFGMVLSGKVMKENREEPIYCGCVWDYGFVGVHENPATYQNTMEFIAVVLGVAIAARAGYRNTSMRIKGDSMSALCWAKGHKYSSEFIRRAATAMVMLSTSFGLDIVESEHVAGVLNVVCDDLSRGRSPADLGWEGRVCEIRNDEWMMELVGLCDPMSKVETAEQFSVFWAAINCWIKKV